MSDGAASGAGGAGGGGRGDEGGEGGEGGPRYVSIEDLSIPDLQQLARQLDAEIQSLNQSVEGLRLAHKRFSDSKAAVAVLAPGDEGKEMLVPLTANMLVPGKLESTKEVLVDVGGGYFVQKDLAGAQAYLQKRIAVVADNLEKSSARLQEQRDRMDFVTAMLSQKMALYNSAAAAAASPEAAVLASASE